MPYSIPKIAIILLNCENISGGGGAERQIVDFFDYYQTLSNPSYQLFFITNPKSQLAMQSIGRLANTQNVVLVSDGKNGLYKRIFQPLQIIKFWWKYRFDGFHIPLVHVYYIGCLKFLSKLPHRLRPKLTMTVVDCSIAHEFFDENATNTTNQVEVYRQYFNQLKFDGIFSWYQLFVEHFANFQFLNHPLLRSARYCFTDLQRFKPAYNKKNQIIFAARLTEIKEPAFFVEGVRLALEKNSNLFQNWEFLMFGKGNLETQIREQITSSHLEHRILVTSAPDMSSYFAVSKVFVSTQLYENFTSLSMLEAMACGNAIIARNVGQTHFFVKEGENGYLLKKDSSEGLADRLIEYVSHPERHTVFQQRSIEIATEEHCIENFTQDFEIFWNQLFQEAKLGRIPMP